MVSDGNLHVGMSFPTFGDVKNHTDKMAKMTGQKIEKRTAEDKDIALGNYFTSKGTSGVQYETSKRGTHYAGFMGGRTYDGITKDNLKNDKDKIMQLRFKKIISADGKQYAEDKNGNGKIDKGEIHDCIWK